jgi:hypothetical protein
LLDSSYFIEAPVKRTSQNVALPIAFSIALLIGCATNDATHPKQKPAGPTSARGPAWTILALELHGPTSARDAQRYAETLKSTAGIRADEVFVREIAGGARLYYGSYAWPDSKKGGRTPMPAQLRNDLAMLKQLGDPAGGRYFFRAMPVRMPTPDVGNPQWALSNAKGLYTLQVGFFEPTGDFTQYKEAASEFCKLLREQGHEAYYHHTDAASMVTVGSFGREAIIEPPRDKRAAERGIVAIPTYHPSIIAMQQEELLKYNLLNGGIQYVRKPDGSRVPVMSRLVEIPHARESAP